MLKCTLIVLFSQESVYNNVTGTAYSATSLYTYIDKNIYNVMGILK